MSLDAFLATWEAATLELERVARQSLQEFSMTDAAQAFAAAAGIELGPDRCRQLGASYVREWQDHVVPIDGVVGLVERLSASWRVGVVSNTHDREMVPSLLRAMGLPSFDVVVLSVEHGRCKPHPSIYTAALADLGVDPGRAVFVGDSLDADFTGPESLGIESYLIDPDHRHEVPIGRRLDSVLDLEHRLVR